MEFLTCLLGHRNVRDKWRASAIDPACLLCPVCSEVADDSKPTRRAAESVAGVERAAIPVGRRAYHLTSLIRKLEQWIEAREFKHLDVKALRQSVAMLREYQALLTSLDIDLATGADLDRLLDLLPREFGRDGKAIETDDEYRARGKRYHELYGGRSHG